MNVLVATALAVSGLAIAIAIFTFIESAYSVIYNKVSNYRYIKSLNVEVDETQE
jgi:hypothetical protein